MGGSKGGGAYLVIDPVEEARHYGKERGLQLLDVVQEQFDVTPEEADLAAVEEDKGLRTQHRKASHLLPSQSAVGHYTRGTFPGCGPTL